MSREGKSTAVPILMALVIVLLPPVAYVTAYFVAGTYACEPDPFEPTPTMVVNRDYSYGWQVLLFTPAGHLESNVRGLPVILSSPYRGNTIRPVDDDGDFWQ